MGTVVKEKVGELEDEVREIFYRITRKDLTGVVKEVSGKRRFLLTFQDVFEKDLTSNKTTIMILDNIPMPEETDMSTIYVIPDETIDLDKG